MFLAGIAAALAALAAGLLVTAFFRRRPDPGTAAASVEARIRGGQAQAPDGGGKDTAEERRPGFLDRAAACGAGPDLLALAGLAGGAAGGLLLWGLIGSPLLAAMAALGGAAGAPFALVAVRERQRMEQLNVQFQSALEQMVAGLRAGATLHQTFQHVAAESPEPLRTEFQLVARLMGMRPADEAVQVLPQRIPTREVELFATAVAFHAQSGGSLADVLLKVADLIRERQTFRKQVRALTAEGRMTTWLIAGMPVLMLGTFRLMVPDYLRSATSTVTGQLIVGAALAMVAVGVVVINRIISGVAEGAD